MNLLLVYNDGYEGSAYEYDEISQVVEHLKNSSCLEDYQLYVYIDKLDIKGVMQRANSSLEEARKAALAKLDKEDLKALGLTES